MLRLKGFLKTLEKFCIRKRDVCILGFGGKGFKVRLLIISLISIFCYQ